jgi:hypothetical protein
MDAAEIGQVVVRIQSEFLDRPGVRLTRAEVERLCSVTGEACDAILALLIDAGVLRRMPDGSLMHAATADARPDLARPAAPLARAASPFARVGFHSLGSLGFPRRPHARGPRGARKPWLN